MRPDGLSQTAEGFNGRTGQRPSISPQAWIGLGGTEPSRSHSSIGRKTLTPAIRFDTAVATKGQSKMSSLIIVVRFNYCPV